MDISRSAAGENITVREDCVVSEPATSFLFPLGKIFSKKSKTGVTFLGKKSDIQWCREDLFEFFPKVVTQQMAVLEIPPVEGNIGEFGVLANWILLK